MNALLRDVRSPGWATAGTSSAIAIFLHGFGSNERDLTGLAPALALTMPWAALRAPIELANGGAAWFTITTPGNPDPGPVACARAPSGCSPRSCEAPVNGGPRANPRPA